MDSTASTLEAPTSPTLLFRVGGMAYGCDIAGAQEIIPPRHITRLPGAPACVRGLINLRGTIVTVIDLGVRLDPTRAPTPDAPILLVRHGERLIGIAVEEVSDVRSVHIDEGADAAAGADDASAWGSRGTLMRGVATTDDGTAVVLDLDRLITQVLQS